MDYRLLFTQRALSDLAEIVGHVTGDDGEAASLFGNALPNHVDLLTRFTRMGSTIRNQSRVRKLLHNPFLDYYQIREDRRLVEALHFRHGSRKAAGF